jgi:uncharacterized membrane protein HdeD (DUF308 family)
MVVLHSQVEPVRVQKSPWGLLAFAGIVGAVSGAYVLHDPVAADTLAVVSGTVLLGSGFIAVGFALLSLLNKRMEQAH